MRKMKKFSCRHVTKYYIGNDENHKVFLWQNTRFLVIMNLGDKFVLRDDIL
jgi:hypothetical protein